MKKLLLTIIVSVLFINIGFSQKIRFTAAKYIEYHPAFQEWDDWPEDWTYFNDNTTGRLTMAISEAVRGKIYHVTMYKDGSPYFDMYLTYDAVKSAEKRRQWNDEYVNCYVDDDGDYLYAQKVSLQSLAEDTRPWATNEESKIYFWVFSQNFAMVLK
jgi:hypothetical protein